MNALKTAAVVLISALAVAACAEDLPVPPVGQPAPDFSLPSESGKTVGLKDFRGEWVVLYFYPKDFTHGCTIEAHNFQRDLAQYQKRGAVIVGVSVQDAASHKDFCAKEGLGFTLLADTHDVVSKEYGSLADYHVMKLSARRTFLIDPDGIIRKEFLKVDPKTHSKEVLAALDELAPAAAPAKR